MSTYGGHGTFWVALGIRTGFSSAGDVCFSCAKCSYHRWVNRLQPDFTLIHATLETVLTHVRSCPKQTGPVAPAVDTEGGPGPTGVCIQKAGHYQPLWGNEMPGVPWTNWAIEREELPVHSPAGKIR